MLVVRGAKRICNSAGVYICWGRAAWGSSREGRFLAKAGGGGRLKVMGGRKAVASATGRLLRGCWVRQFACWLLHGIEYQLLC